MPSVPTTSRIGRLLALEGTRSAARLQHVVSTDALVRLVLGTGFWALYALLGSTVASTRVFGRDDVYVHLFDADVYPFIGAVSGAWPSLFRTETHPLFMLFFRPVGAPLARALGSDVAVAVFLTSFIGAACVALAHLFLRLAGLPGLSALLWSAILGLSFAHLVFGSMPDTFIFSAASVITLFVLAARYPGSLRHFVPAAIVASGILVTNFAQSAIVFVVSLWRDASARHRLLATVRLLALVGIAVLALGLVQGRLYPPTAPRFLYLAREVNWMFVPRSWDRGLQRFKDLHSHVFVYSLVSPRLELVGPVRPRHRGEMPILSMQRRALRLRPVGAAAAGLWGGLMVAGAVGLVRGGSYRRPEIIALAASILFNLGLHYFYGREMFLYSADWMFLLVGLVALGVTRGYAPGGRMARLCLAAAIGLLVCEALNNGAVLLDLVRAFETFRQLNS